jgi:outer membrane receptor protein involved in Fe transport
LSFVETSYFNAAEYHYQGVLAALDYRRATPFLGAGSRVGVNLQYQYLKTLNQKSTAGATPSHFAGTLGYPHHSAVLNVNWQRGDVGLFTSLNYTGSVLQEADEPDNYREHERLDAVTFVNAGVSWQIAHRVTARFMVDNLLNTRPPYPVPADGGVVSYFPGVLGRYYRLGLAVHF